MFSSWIACNIVSLMLSNFVWTKNLTKLCFSYFTANNWLNFRETAFTKCSNMLMPDKATPIDQSQPLRNVEIEALLVVTAAVINTVQIAFETVAKHLRLKNRRPSCLFLPAYNLTDLPLVVMMPQGLNLDKFYSFCCRIHSLSLFNKIKCPRDNYVVNNTFLIKITSLIITLLVIVNIAAKVQVKLTFQFYALENLQRQFVNFHSLTLSLRTYMDEALQFLRQKRLDVDQ